MALIDLIKKRFLWVVIGAILFYILFILVSDVEKIFESFLQIKVEFLILIFALGFVSHLVKSLRQKDLLNTLGEKISYLQNMSIYMAGLSLITTPGGIGTFIKSIYLKERINVPTEKSIAIIFIERYHDLLAGTSIILVSLLLYSSTISLSLMIFSAIILGGTYLLLKSQRIFTSFYSRLLKIKFISKNFPKVEPTKSFSTLTSSKSMTKGWLFSILGWSIDSLAVYLVFLSLNVDLGFLLTSQIYFTSLGYGVLSFLPAGIGVNEGVADFLLIRQGLDFSVASSLVILTRLSTLWFATAIGVIFTRMELKQTVKP
ncbi:MAG: flippase-like domain-containing protein [Nitrosopumilus sp.]|nr:flippase-like domain-containing protein [Nitrosopumilus sp.]MDH3385316.1 flippase-like domain-containing protein [Nitrosopumilus sp.]